MPTTARLLAVLLAAFCLPVSAAHARVVQSGRPAALRIAPDPAAPRSGRVPARAWLPILGRYTSARGVFYRVSVGPASGWLAARGVTVRSRVPLPLPDCAKHHSRSLGTYGNGRLQGGVLFPASGPDHFAWNFRQQRVGGSDRTRWGNCRVIVKVLKGLRAYRAAHPDAPPVAVGDMSLRHGGDIDWHATHENGLNIDLYYPRKDRRRMEPHTVSQVDQRLAQALVHTMLRHGASEALIGEHMRHMRTSSRVFRWPLHDDHVHLIFPKQ